MLLLFPRIPEAGLGWIAKLAVQFGGLAVALVFAFRWLGIWEGTAQRHGRELDLSGVRQPLLLIRSSGDEASGALGMSQVIGWVVGRLYDVIASVAGIPIGLVLGLVGLLAPLGACGAYAAYVILFGTLPLLAHLAAWLMLVVVAVAILAGGLVWLSGIGYGITSMLVDYTAEATPPGKWSVSHWRLRENWVLIDPEETDGSEKPASRTFLAHSSIYQHAGALSECKHWLQDQYSVQSANPTAV
jgi:hypothetical protein